MEKYEDLYVKNLAEKKDISIKAAVLFIDKCIKSAAQKLNLPYSEVYGIIYSEEFMSMCLKGKCSDKDLDDCSKSCWCVVFEGKCYPRRFEDADVMNADPDKYMLGMSTDKLAGLVKIASYLYYNYDGGGISDNTFDALEYTLNKRLKLKGRRYDKIGAPPVDKIKKKLPYPMPSLDKVKPGTRDLLSFIHTATEKSFNVTGKKQIQWSLKLDGVSGLLIYKNGVCREAYTRGDGTIGGDVSYILDYISPLPKIAHNSKYKDIVVRVEFIIRKDVWMKKYGGKATEKGRSTGEYSNPRSFVSSKINSGYIPAMGIMEVEALAYSILDLNGKGTAIPSPSESMQILSSLGFKTPENGVLVDPVTFDLMSLYKKKRDSALYGIDGLVLTEDVPYDPVRPGAEKRAVAFKMKLDEQIRETRVLNVEWNITRYGRMVPVAVYESVYIDGARMHRASAFNAGKVKEWSLGKRSRIKVIRSGDVIPTILEVEEDPNINPEYPPAIVPGSLGKDKGWHWDRHDIIVNEPENNKAVMLRRSEHFFVTIGVPKLREKTLEKLWDAGIRTIRGITSAAPEDFAKIKGISKKGGLALHTSIHTTMRRTRLDRFIPASTTLNLGIGRKIIKQLLNYHPTLMEDSLETLKVILPKKNIPGLGTKRIDNIVRNIEAFKTFLFSLNKKDIEFAIKHDSERIKSLAARKYNPKIRGKIFVATGFFGKMDYELEDYVYDNFGMFAPSVTQGTEVVISANLMDITSKMMTAERLGVKVLSIDEFVKQYDVPTRKKVDEDTDDVVLLERIEDDE